MRFSAALTPLLPLAPLRKPADREAPRRPVTAPGPPPAPWSVDLAQQRAAEPVPDLDQRVRLSGEW